MATHIFVDKENSETGTAVKDWLGQLSAPSKVFERSHPKTPLVGRTANVKPLALNSSRKALGNVNRPLTATKNQIPKGKKAASAKKATENKTGVEHCNMIEEYQEQEKENLFSYNPLDDENFEVPEEHKLSHMSLTGVPLMIFENVPDRFASTIPAPVKPPSIAWDYDTLLSTEDFLDTLDEIIIDLPPPCNM